MRPCRAMRILFGLCFVASIEVGCGGSGANPNVDADGKALTAPPPPGRKPKAAEKMKNVMPHL
jgi:hypothetical protein